MFKMNTWPRNCKMQSRPWKEQPGPDPLHYWELPHHVEMGSSQDHHLSSLNQKEQWSLRFKLQKLHNKFIPDFKRNLTNILLLESGLTFPILLLFPLVVLKLKLRICTRSLWNTAWTAVTCHRNWFPWSTD